MSGSTFGNKFKITTWGESHGKALGVVVDGCPAGLPLTEDDIQVYLNRRRPGFSQFSTPRKESDQLQIMQRFPTTENPREAAPQQIRSHLEIQSRSQVYIFWNRRRTTAN